MALVIAERRTNDCRPVLHPGPIQRGKRWSEWVNGIESEAELNAIRHSIARRTPYGASRWQVSAARRLGLESSLRPRGRTRKGSEK
jgi:putative transposase